MRTNVRVWRKIMKRIIISVVGVFLVLVFSLPTLAHSGRTDSNGGHYNHSTGVYHYHHGYPEHQHYDIDGNGTIDCPYTYTAPTISQDYDFSFSITESDPYKYLPKDNYSQPSFDLKFDGFVSVPKTEESESTDESDSNATMIFLWFFLIPLSLFLVFAKFIFKPAEPIEEKETNQERMQREILQKYIEPLENPQAYIERVKREKKEEDIRRRRPMCGYFLENANEDETNNETDSSAETKENNETEKNDAAVQQEQKYIYIIRSSKDYWE
jgi:hypothetical protein